MISYGVWNRERYRIYMYSHFIESNDGACGDRGQRGKKCKFYFIIEVYTQWWVAAGRCWSRGSCYQPCNKSFVLSNEMSAVWSDVIYICQSFALVFPRTFTTKYCSPHAPIATKWMRRTTTNEQRKSKSLEENFGLGRSQRQITLYLFTSDELLMMIDSCSLILIPCFHSVFVAARLLHYF